MKIERIGPHDPSSLPQVSERIVAPRNGGMIQNRTPGRKRVTLVLVTILATINVAFVASAAILLSRIFVEPKPNYEKVDAVAQSLSLEKAGSAAPCVNSTGGSFSHATICRTTVTGPRAAAKIGEQLSAAGYTLSLSSTDGQFKSTTWVKGSGYSQIDVIVTERTVGSRYADPNGDEKTVEHESALVNITVQ